MKKSILLSSLLFMAVSVMAQQAVITFQKTEHNFGKINESDGRVSTIFEFKNEGMEPLVLSNVRASCGCTTPTWTRTPIEPGETGTVTVTYNPKGRPGRFSKTVTITSNASNATTRLYIKGEVIPAAAKPANKYPVKMGELSLSQKTMQFGTIKKGSNITRSIEYANLTDDTLTVSVLMNNNDMFLTPVLSLERLRPKESGTLNLNFDAATCKEWGPVTRHIYVMVNGKRELTDDYKINLYANIEEDFSLLTAAERQKAPIAEVVHEIDLGTLKAGEKASRKVPLKNVGVNTLQLRRLVNNNSGILKVEPARWSIKGGKSTDLKVELTALQSNGTKLGAGNYRRQIEIITNDPQQPKLYIYIKWTVE